MRPDQVLFSRHQDFFPAKLPPLRSGVTGIPAIRQSGNAGQGVPFPSGIAVIPEPTTTRRSDRVQSAMLANPRLNDVQFR